MVGSVVFPCLSLRVLRVLACPVCLVCPAYLVYPVSPFRCFTSSPAAGTIPPDAQPNGMATATMETSLRMYSKSAHRDIGHLAAARKRATSSGAKSSLRQMRVGLSFPLRTHIRTVWGETDRASATARSVSSLGSASGITLTVLSAALRQLSQKPATVH